MTNPTASVDHSQVAAKHRAMWASGDYAKLATELVSPLGPVLVQATGIAPGDRVLDVASGTGNAAIPAAEAGGSVVASDLCPELLEQGSRLAAERGVDLEWREANAHELPFGDDEFDVVISSLALHYIEPFDLVCQNTYRCLVSGGELVVSVEHPIFTALAAQEWCFGPKGERLHWPVDDYQKEGPRHTQWMADDVVKYHRTLSTYVNTLIDSGFRISKLLEPQPTREMLNEQPELQDDYRRPTFLMIAAVKNQQ